MDSGESEGEVWKYADRLETGHEQPERNDSSERKGGSSDDLKSDDEDYQKKDGTLKEEEKLDSIESDEEDPQLDVSSEVPSSMDSSDASDDEDEKRRVAEVFKDCFLKVAEKSAARAQKNSRSRHAIQTWWRKGSLAGHKRKAEEKKSNEDKDVLTGEQMDEEEEAGRRLEWATKTKIRAKGISASLDDIKVESDRKLTKRMEKKKKALPSNRWEPLPKPKKIDKHSSWVDTPSAEITEDVKRDLTVLKMRDTLDPTRFYKKLDMKKDPKWLQVGTVLDNPFDGPSGSLPKRLRRKSIAEQWLADPEVTAMRSKRIGNITDARRAESKTLFKNQPYLKSHRKKLRK